MYLFFLNVSKIIPMNKMLPICKKKKIYIYIYMKDGFKLHLV